MWHHTTWPLPYFLEFFPLLNCSVHPFSGSSWMKWTPLLNSPHTMCVCDYLGGRGSILNCSIARVAPQRASKPIEIVIYDRSIVQCDCIRSICHDPSADFTFVWAKFARSAMHIQVRKCCDINCTCPCFIFPPSNCTRMLAHLEINSTRGKYSRKYGNWLTALGTSAILTCSDWH